MTLARQTLRADVLAALPAVQTGHAPLSAAPVISAWASSLDAKTLPVIGITLPTVEKTPAAIDQDEQTITLIVVVKRTGLGDGADLETALDADCVALGAPLEAALMTHARDVYLRKSTIEISASGSPLIGTLTLTYTATTWSPRTQP